MKKHPLYFLLIFSLGLCTGFILRSNVAKGIYLNASQIDAPWPLEQLPVVAKCIQRQDYVLAYDGRTRNAFYVHETITRDSLQGEGERAHHQFVEDQDIPQHIRASLADFKGSGYDRGHLSPCAHHRSNKACMADSFLLSNVIPQDPQYNRGFWLKLERHVRDLTKHYDSVKVITGPLFVPEDQPDGRYVHVRVIGDSNIWCPTHLYKVIKMKSDRGVEAKAFLVPNQPISADATIEQFETTVEKIEKLSGIIFQS